MKVFPYNFIKSRPCFHSSSGGSCLDVWWCPVREMKRWLVFGYLQVVMCKVRERERERESGVYCGGGISGRILRAHYCLRIRVRKPDGSCMRKLEWDGFGIVYVKQLNDNHVCVHISICISPMCVKCIRAHESNLLQPQPSNLSKTENSLLQVIPLVCNSIVNLRFLLFFYIMGSMYKPNFDFINPKGKLKLSEKPRKN